MIQFIFFIVPEGIHHVASIHTYCNIHRKNSNYTIQIFAKLSTADFVSMWHRIIGTQQQID